MSIPDAVILLPHRTVIPFNAFLCRRLPSHMLLPFTPSCFLEHYELLQAQRISRTSPLIHRRLLLRRRQALRGTARPRQT